MKSLLQVAEGNSYICNIIQSQNLFPILFINSFYMNNKSIYILIDNLFNDINNKYILNNNKYIYGIFNKNIGHITASEINLNSLNNIDIFNSIFSVKDYYKKNVFFNFLLNNYDIKDYDIKKNYSKIFSLFQGSHNSLFLKNINVVLPGLTFLEKISNYINIKAMNRKTQAILPHEKSMRID
jgi:hypothetical protein